MQNLFRIVLAGAVLWAAALSADTSAMVEGRIDGVQQDQIMMGSQAYAVIYPATEKSRADAQAYGFETECWVVSPIDRYRIDYITLVKVGYVNLARVTLQGKVVRTIEVLDLQQ